MLSAHWVKPGELVWLRYVAQCRYVEPNNSQRMGCGSIEPEGGFWIGPTGTGNRREPSWSRRVAVIGVAAKAPVERGVHLHLVAIEPHAEPGASGHADRAVFVFKFAADDDVIDQMVVMRISGKG